MTHGRTKNCLARRHRRDKPFWDAAREGRFVVPVCSACGRAHWYPRAICPFCASDKIEWREASGRGTIYTFSVMRRVKEPYAIAHVTLAEGPTMLTNIVDCDFDGCASGRPSPLCSRKLRTARRCRCSSPRKFLFIPL